MAKHSKPTITPEVEAELIVKMKSVTEACLELAAATIHVDDVSLDLEKFMSEHGLGNDITKIRLSPDTEQRIEAMLKTMQEAADASTEAAEREHRF